MLLIKKMGFRYAFSGIWYMFKNESNTKVHLIATVMVFFFGVLLRIAAIEWLLLLFAIMSVIVAEIFNSALELLCDFITEERNLKIKIIKDLGAGGVLLSAIFATVIGLIIFLPKLIPKLL